MTELGISRNSPLSDRVSVIIDYTNWRGERRKRTIIPMAVYWSKNEYHPEPQWLLRALDWEKREIRDFAMTGIHSWEPANP